jgi:hypothetical protein
VKLRRYSVIVLLTALIAIPAFPWQEAQDEKPLPDLDAFIKELRGRLHADQTLLNSYTYTEKQTIRSLDGKGNLKSVQESVYEIYPSIDPDQTYRRLISRDGKPTPPEELAKRDGEYDKKASEYRRKLEREGAEERERRLARENEEKRKEERAIEDLFRLYEIRMEGREWIGEHAAIVLSFQPRPRVKPQTDEGKILTKVSGRAWFNEQEYELMRIEAALLDSLSRGWGLLLRLNKGAKVALERRKINDEIWLPVEVHFTGRARLLLLKGLNVDYLSRYSDFLKFDVETQMQFRKVP